MISKAIDLIVRYLVITLIMTLSFLLLMASVGCEPEREIEYSNTPPEIMIRGAVIEHPKGKDIPPVSVVGDEPLPWSDTVTVNFKNN